MFFFFTPKGYLVTLTSGHPGGPEGAKVDGSPQVYCQNPAEIGFFFRFDTFSCHHWKRGLPKRYKVTPLSLT